MVLKINKFLQRYIIFTHALFFAVALIHQILQMWRQFKFSGRPDHWKPKSHFKISINMAIRVMKHAQVKTFFWNFAHFLHFLEIWNFSGTNQKSFSFLREVWLIFNLWYPWLEFRWKYGAVSWNQIFGKNIYPWVYLSFTLSHHSYWFYICTQFTYWTYHSLHLDQNTIIVKK